MALTQVPLQSTDDGRLRVLKDLVSPVLAAFGILPLYEAFSDSLMSENLLCPTVKLALVWL